MRISLLFLKRGVRVSLVSITACGRIENVPLVDRAKALPDREKRARDIIVGPRETRKLIYPAFML